MIRRQLPVHSPLSWAAVRAAMSAAGSDPRPALLDRVGAAGVILTDSGTGALSVAIAAGLRRRPGRPVALPAYGCFDLVTAARGAGASVVLYDLDPRTLLPDGQSLREALAFEPSSVVFVHHYGIPVRLAEWRPEVEAAGALLIEDAAQGAGASVDGRPVGTQGDLGILSFGRGKGITAGGGGALLGRPSDLAALSSLIGPAPSDASAFVIKLAAQWALGRPTVYGLPARLPFLGLGETRYREPRACCRMSARMQGVLSLTLALAPDEESRRRHNAQRLLEQAEPDVLRRIPVPALGTEAGWLRLPFRARGPSMATDIGCVRGYPMSLAELPEARAVLSASVRAPGARELVDSLWTVPVHGHVTASDLGRIAAWMRGTGG